MVLASTLRERESRKCFFGPQLSKKGKAGNGFGLNSQRKGKQGKKWRQLSEKGKAGNGFGLNSQRERKQEKVSAKLQNKTKLRGGGGGSGGGDRVKSFAHRK